VTTAAGNRFEVYFSSFLWTHVNWYFIKFTYCCFIGINYQNSGH
jgi:hypothetical protein